MRNSASYAQTIIATSFNFCSTPLDRDYIAFYQTAVVAQLTKLERLILSELLELVEIRFRRRRVLSGKLTSALVLALASITKKRQVGHTRPINALRLSAAIAATSHQGPRALYRR